MKTNLKELIAYRDLLLNLKSELTTVDDDGKIARKAMFVLVKVIGAVLIDIAISCRSLRSE